MSVNISLMNYITAFYFCAICLYQICAFVFYYLNYEKNV